MNRTDAVALAGPDAAATHHEALALAGELNHEVVHLTRAVHVLRQHLTAQAPDGVQWSTYVLLFHLVKDGPRRAGALAESVFVDPSTISRQIDQLVRMGLVERRADPADGRATLLAATDAGVQAHHSLKARRAEMTAAVLADWSPDDVRTLTRLLGRFTTGLTENMPSLLTTFGGTDPQKDPS